jgi:GT2 family glycosyltransferase
MKLSIVIVSYNVKCFLEQCLKSVEKAVANLDAEIFVVDNNSSDGSQLMIKEKFPAVQFIENKDNVGFAKANNQAIKIATGDFVLLLNPDTLVEEDTFHKCVHFLENHPDAGALGVKMINGNGEFLPESKRGLPLPNVAFYKIFGLAKLFPKSEKFGSYHLSYLDKEQINSVEVLSGAFMMIKKEVLDKIGLLDESFFMYGEDIDLSYRIMQAGYKNYYFPEARIIHYKGESTKKGSLNYVFVFYKAMQLFVKKHFVTKNAFMNILINFAIWFRAGLAALKRIAIKLLLPVLDIIVIYAGVLGLSKYWEYAVLSYRNSAFPPVYQKYIIPLYTLIWIVCIFLCKGYRKPFKLSNINKGILIGTALILFVYALLPETYRFSRAVLIFGSGWTMIALNFMRFIFAKMSKKDFSFKNRSLEKTVVVGHSLEAEKIVFLNKLLNPKTVYADIIVLKEDDKSSVSKEIHVLDIFDNIDKIIENQKINTLIFCYKDVPATVIIATMEKYHALHIDFKIASFDNLSLIGSNSIVAP